MAAAVPRTYEFSTGVDAQTPADRCQLQMRKLFSSDLLNLPVNSS
jgi:hypothetical protein